MKRTPIPLPSQSELLELFDYDQETGQLFWKERKFQSIWNNGWNTKYANKPAGVSNNQGYLVVGINKKKYLAHRIIWKLLYNTEPPIIDHIDKNRSNNSRSNLREADTSLSAFNKFSRPSRFPRGVQPNKNGFKAQIKTIYLGTYKTPEEAHEVYLLAADMIYNNPPARMPGQ